MKIQKETNEYRLKILESLGYEIKEDVDICGKWVWFTKTEGCESSFDSIDDAIYAAWLHSYS